jgi:hypothetical protein
MGNLDGGRVMAEGGGSGRPLAKSRELAGVHGRALGMGSQNEDLRKQV